ncbi:MAG TPA: SDR family oxidoreductase [Bacteroidales bacterium]|nr:SDR family oxidoreductase [Bacteroidales bacterium]
MKKVIFITGVSSGLGLAIAKQLEMLGHIVYGSSRNENFDLEGIQVIKMDVTRSGEIDQAIQFIISREGRIDVLINNAGIGLAGAIEDFSEQEAYFEMNTNFLGAYRCCKVVLPYMRKQKGGTIITIGSIAGLMGLPYQGFYSASKFALEGLMESLRYEAKQWGIRVVMVNPGDFRTGFTANRLKVENSVKSEYQKSIIRALTVIGNDETGGLLPDTLARKLSKIIIYKNPKHRYIVASFEQKLAVLLSKILPSKWFSKIIAGHYKV